MKFKNKLITYFGNNDYSFYDYETTADICNSTKFKISNDYLMFFSTDSGYMNNDGKNFQEFPKNSITLFFPGTSHSVGQKNPGRCKMVYISFNASFMKSIINFLGKTQFADKLQGMSEPVSIELSDRRINDIIHQFLQLKMYSAEQLFIDAKIKSMVCEFLLLFFESFLRTDNESQLDSEEPIPTWLSSLCYKMQNIDNFSKDVSHMAKLANCSKGHLSRCMKKYYNITPIEFITNNRLHHARGLLVRTELPITDIFMSVGYSNISWGYHQFAKKYSCTPMEYRKKHYELD